VANGPFLSNSLQRVAFLSANAGSNAGDASKLATSIHRNRGGSRNGRKTRWSRIGSGICSLALEYEGAKQGKNVVGDDLGAGFLLGPDPVCTVPQCGVERPVRLCKGSGKLDRSNDTRSSRIRCRAANPGTHLVRLRSRHSNVLEKLGTAFLPSVKFALHESDLFRTDSCVGLSRHCHAVAELAGVPVECSAAADSLHHSCLPGFDVFARALRGRRVSCVYCAGSPVLPIAAMGKRCCIHHESVHALYLCRHVCLLVSDFLMDSEQFRIHALMEDSHWWFLARRQIIRLLIRKLVSPGARLVEIGCGTGGNVAAFSDEFTCAGIDPSGIAIQLARERFSGVNFLHGDAVSLLSGINTDICLVLDVLEHVEDDVGFLASIVGAAPGSVFIVTVPAGPQLWSGHDVALGHYRRYTMDQFRLLWEQLPLECVLCSYFNSKLYPLVRTARFFSARFDRTLGRAGTDLGGKKGGKKRCQESLFGS